MDTRNYDEPSNCGLESCDCDEDNKCGCSFPNNMADFDCECTDTGNCGRFDEHLATPRETVTHIVKDTVCVCSPETCSCSVERSETDA